MDGYYCKRNRVEFHQRRERRPAPARPARPLTYVAQAVFIIALTELNWTEAAVQFV